MRFASFNSKRRHPLSISNFSRRDRNKFPMIAPDESRGEADLWPNGEIGYEMGLQGSLCGPEWITGKDASLSMTSHIVIPARLASTRLERKLLLCSTGKTLIHHTYEAAQQAKLAQGVCVATDSHEIFAEVERFGGHAKMTDPAATCGTDRVAEVAAQLGHVDIVVNLQGDEPELPGAAIDQAIRLLEDNPTAVMSTLAAPIRCPKQLQDPACVKVVFDSAGRALYFSRSPIPHAGQPDEKFLDTDAPNFYQHIGLYVYRREFLLKIATLPPSRLERIEKLEQLRVLEAGHTILVGQIDQAAPGIDTPEDYQAFVQRMQSQSRAA